MFRVTQSEPYFHQCSLCHSDNDKISHAGKSFAVVNCIGGSSASAAVSRAVTTPGELFACENSHALLTDCP